MMPDLSAAVLELIRLTSTSLPSDVEGKLKTSLEIEDKNSAARNALQTIIHNIEIAREHSTPLCQDTGTPIFYVHHPEKYKTRYLESIIREAVAEATALALLRPNAVDGFTGKNSGNNLGGAYFPIIHFDTVDEETLTIDLMLKGGGCENVGRQYSLPDEKLNAGRDLEGVRIAALDAVCQAQGMGCAPGFLGIAVGGDRGTSYLASKEVFFAPVDSHHPDAAIAELETRITREANQLGIGPMGFGGKTTILGTRITGLHRLPASFFVTVSYMCWAFRRRRLTISDESVQIS
jgi:fumarate hydratase, class I